MKRATALSILISFLLATTSLGELLKVPLLIRHFSEHTHLTDNISFVDFIYQHYIKESVDDTEDPDFAKDSKLPFKSDEISHFHFAPFILPPSKSEPFLKPTSLFFKRNNFSPLISFSANIWQPPRSILIF